MTTVSMRRGTGSSAQDMFVNVSSSQDDVHGGVAALAHVTHERSCGSEATLFRRHVSSQ